MSQYQKNDERTLLHEIPQILDLSDNETNVTSTKAFIVNFFGLASQKE